MTRRAPNGQRRIQLALRVNQAAEDALKKRAREEQLMKRSGEPNKSEMARLAMAYGMAKMPRGWRPEGWETD